MMWKGKTLIFVCCIFFFFQKTTSLFPPIFVQEHPRSPRIRVWTCKKHKSFKTSPPIFPHAAENFQQQYWALKFIKTTPKTSPTLTALSLNENIIFPRLARTESHLFVGFFYKITDHKHAKSSFEKPPLPVPKACSQSRIHLEVDTDGFHCSKQINSKPWKGLSFITHSKKCSGLSFFPQRVRK